MSIFMVNNECSADVTGVTVASNDDIRFRIQTNTNYFDTNYSRFAHYTDPGSLALWPALNTPNYDDVDDFWFHISLRTTANVSTSFYVRDGSAGNIYRIFFTGGSTSTRVEIYSYNDGGTATSVSYTLTLNVLYRFDFHFDRVANDLKLYINDSLTTTLALDVNRRTNNPVMTDIRMTTVTTVRYFSELCAAFNESTLFWRVKSLYPNGAGTNSDWTGAYTDVDENALDTLTLNTISAQGNQTYAYTDIQAGIMTDRQVAALVITSVADATAGTNTNLKNVYYDGGTLRDLGSAVDVASNGYINGVTAYALTDPATGSLWVYTDINSYEFGFASGAGADSELRVTKQAIGVLITPIPTTETRVAKQAVSVLMAPEVTPKAIRRCEQIKVSV